MTAAEHDPEAHDRERFTRRLEAFSDIVFGFALAQCAFALEVPKSLAQLGAEWHGLLYFAVTFVLIATFWFMHYRVFHYAFAARPLDVVLNFALLATVALLPYALRLYITFNDSVPGSVAYAAALGSGFSLLAALEWRGLRLPPRPMTPKAERLIRRGLWRHGAAGIIFLLSVPVIAYFGLYARSVWALIGLAIAVLRIVERRAPTSVVGTPAPAAEL
ncbi:MAG: DUF1211 domain-containing protein [Candidatus Eremiobacteraeota bacterium]|nr:DUF1211 domain-containing protein [Candidatus Eremiobacteraeota bacterium]